VRLSVPNRGEDISIDEMTGIQAFERKRYPDQPMCPGKRERREFEYIRHGTNAHAACDVAGQIVRANVGIPARPADYFSHVQQLRN